MKYYYTLYTFLLLLSTVFIIQSNYLILLGLYVFLLLILISPISILMLIIIVNPFSEWLVIKVPSLFTKEIIDIMIFIFILKIIIKVISEKRTWNLTSLHKWLIVFLGFYLVSSFLHWYGAKGLLFMNWIHFRFIYLGIALLQMELSEKHYRLIINTMMIGFVIQLFLGTFQMIGGEWAKNVFFGNIPDISISIGGVHQFSPYPTNRFNLVAGKYIYSTFALPIRYGSFLLSMLCLYFGLLENNTNYKLLNKLRIIILPLSVLFIILTFNRSVIFSLIVILFVLLYVKKGYITKFTLYFASILIPILIIYNYSEIINFLRELPKIDLLKQELFIRILDVAKYFLEDTPRKYAYIYLLPYILTNHPIWGLGVTIFLNKGYIFTDPKLNESLYYSFGDAGIVRFFVEFGVLGTLIFFFIIIDLFRKTIIAYKINDRPYIKERSFSVLLMIPLIIPMSIGYIAMLSKSFGLYFWLYVGLFLTEIKTKQVEHHG